MRPRKVRQSLKNRRLLFYESLILSPRYFPPLAGLIHKAIRIVSIIWFVMFFGMVTVSTES